MLHAITGSERIYRADCDPGCPASRRDPVRVVERVRLAPPSRSYSCGISDELVRLRFRHLEIRQVVFVGVFSQARHPARVAVKRLRLPERVKPYPTAHPEIPAVRCRKLE